MNRLQELQLKQLAGLSWSIFQEVVVKLNEGAPAGKTIGAGLWEAANKECWRCRKKLVGCRCFKVKTGTTKTFNTHLSEIERKEKTRSAIAATKAARARLANDEPLVSHKGFYGPADEELELFDPLLARRLNK